MMATALLIGLGFGCAAVAVLLGALLYALHEIGHQLARMEDLRGWFDAAARAWMEGNGPEWPEPPGDEWKRGS